MKSGSIIVAFILMCSAALAQKMDKNGDGSKIYYDKDGYKISEGKTIDNRREGKWLVYYKNKLIQEVIFEHNLLNGAFITYDSVIDVIRARGTYKQGKKSGEWRFFNHEGKLYAIEHYYNGFAEDTANYFYSSNGFKQSEGTYLNSKRHGLWAFYDTSGQLIATETYEYGLLNGKAAYFDNNTTVKYAEGYHTGNIRKGQWLFYFRNSGRLKSKETYTAMVLNGPAEYYDSLTGVLRDKGNFKDGKKDGNWQYYDSLTGKLVADVIYEGDNEKFAKVITYDPTSHNILDTTIYINGLLEGEVRKYFSDGKRISCIQHFHKNLRDGLEIAYDSATQKIYYEGNYTAGKENGEWKSYDTLTYKLKTINNYRDGLKHGPVTHFDENTGITISTGQYELGEPVGNWRFFSVTGKLQREENFKHGVLDGNVFFYDTSGNIAQQETFVEGIRQGPGIFYYPYTKKLWITCTYTNDTLNGDLVVFYPSGKIKRQQKSNHANLIYDKCFTEDGKEIECYPLFEEPHFPTDVMTYIGNNLKYPETAKAEHVEGKVVVGFFVNENGLLSDIEIVESADDRLDKEAFRLVSQMPPWVPGQIDGRPYKDYQTLPIVFWIR